jgi:Trypsin
MLTPSVVDQNSNYVVNKYSSADIGVLLLCSNNYKMLFVVLTFTSLICVNAIPRTSTICGSRRSVTGTVFGGNEVKKNSWPWLVALFNRKNEKFFCAGSLISKRHVLSGDNQPFKF